MLPKKYFYPRVIQIMPCENMWFRYVCKETHCFFYCRVPCLALVETQERDGTIVTDVRYIDSDSLGVFEEEPNHESVFYSKRDLTDFTHPLSDERHPLLIGKGIGEASTEPA